MKVIHLVDTFEAKFKRDQIQIVKMCQRKGFETTVITSRFDSDGNLKTKAYFRELDETLGGVTIIRPPSFKLRLPPFGPLLVYLPPTKLFDDYDLVHIYTIGSYCFFLGSLVRRIKHSKTIVRAELSPFWHQRIKGSRLWRRLILAPLRKADAIYAFTEAERQRLLDVGIPEQKVFVIPVSVDYAKFSKIQKKNNHLTIGYLGRFVRLKGSHRLISPLGRLAEEFPQVRIVFGGPQTDPDYAQTVIDSMSKHPNFEYLGVLSPEQFYQLTDIVLVPSSSETGSITTLEAMACGKAVIASNISPMNEYIDDGVSGLLVENEEQFYDYCRDLVQDPVLMQRMGKNAQEKAKQYDQERVFNDMEAIYNRVISKATKKHA